MASIVRVPECPVCLEGMVPPILNCATGHSVCGSCWRQLPEPRLCPICRSAMTDMRNRALEDLVASMSVECSNKAAGCVYKVKQANLEEHLRECIFRDLACPLGVVFGRCFWNGSLKKLMDHFRERHPESVPSGDELTLRDVSTVRDDRRLFLSVVGKCHFLLTFKLDSTAHTASWCAQLIGSKSSARQWVYEVELEDPLSSRRRITFTDYCDNDITAADQILRSGRCAAISTQALDTFLDDGTLVLRFQVKRAGPKEAKGKPDEGGDDAGGPNKPPYKKKGGNKPGGPGGPGGKPDGAGGSGGKNGGPGGPGAKNGGPGGPQKPKNKAQ